MTIQSKNDIKGTPNGDDHDAQFDPRPKWPFWIGTGGRFPSESVAAFIGMRTPFQAHRAVDRRPDPASGPGGRPFARRANPARDHDRCLRCERQPGRLALEGRLRGGRGDAGSLPPALRPRHAPGGRHRARRSRRHARHAGDPRRPGAVADAAIRGTDRAAAVLDAAPARLRRPPGRRHPARRCRARTLRRHRHARGHGCVCAR